MLVPKHGTGRRACADRCADVLGLRLLRISAQDMACIAAAMGVTALQHAAAAPPASAPHTPSLWPELPAR